MEKVIVAIFNNEESAYQGVRELEALNDEGTITLYASGIVKRQLDGTITVLQEAPDGPLGTVVGLATGAMVGLLGGPAGVAVGGFVGAGGGMFYDLAKLGLGEDFLYDVGHNLLPGHTAVIAEVYEEWITPVDVRLEAAGGVVYRRARVEVEDSQYERDVAAFNAEIDQLDAEISEAADEAKAKLQAKRDETKAKLQATKERAKASVENAKQEMDAKVVSLQDQISKSTAETKAKVEKRIAEMKVNHQKRNEKMKQAWELVKQAASI